MNIQHHNIFSGRYEVSRLVDILSLRVITDRAEFEAKECLINTLKRFY